MGKKEKTKTSTAPEDSSNFNLVENILNRRYQRHHPRLPSTSTAHEQMPAMSTPSSSAPKQDGNDVMVSSLPSDFAQMLGHSGSGPSASTLGVTTAITDPSTLELESSNKKVQKSRISSTVTIGQEKAFDKVCDFLTDSKVGIVGIYGMGGVGKTTLMKKVWYEFLIPSKYKVMWIVVSRMINVDDIQMSLMDELKLKFHERQDPQARGMKINEALFNRKDRVALLLDDIWEAIDLEQLGVAGGHGLDTSKFKIIFTTRLEDVCLQMDPDQKMKIECLGPEESWALFKQSVGDKTLNSHYRILGLAKEVAMECAGLPLALTVTGKAMVCKISPEAWEVALKSLKNRPSVVSGAEKIFFEHLKFSYDNLENQVERECFLFCCVYPEDREIDKDKLVESWIGEGLLDVGYGTYQETYNRGHDIIDTLLAKSLLEVMKSKHSSLMIVKMHDVIRDMGLWIGSESNFFVYTYCLELSGEEITQRWNRARHVYIENLYVDIPQKLDCPNLSSLHICGMGRHITISNTFLNSMNFMWKVKVLVFDSVWFTCPEIPESTFGLLVGLRHLEINKSNIRTFPPDIGNLTKLLALILIGNNSLTLTTLALCELRKLQISRCDQLRNLPSELGKLKKLEMVDISTRGGVKIGNIFNHCAELRRLHLDVTGLTTLSDNLLYNLKKLEELHIIFGRRPENVTLWIEGLKRSASLKVLTMSGWPIKDGDKVIYAIGAMHQLRELHIIRCDIDKLVIPEAATDFLPQLKVLEIRECRLLEKVHFSNRTLQSLCVLEIGSCSCSNLDFVHVVGHSSLFDYVDYVDYVQTSVCFPNLQRLRLRSLRQMYCICDDDVSFPSLSEFTLYDCPMLEKLPRGLMNENRTQMISGEIVGTKEWWEGLMKYEDVTFESYLRPLFVDERDFLLNRNPSEDEGEEVAPAFKSFYVLPSFVDEGDFPSLLLPSQDEEEIPFVL